MSRQRKRQFRFATFVILPALLILAALVPVLMSSTASALGDSQFAVVKQYVDSYFTNQYDSARGGEVGIIKGKLDLMDDLTNDGDDVTLEASYLDEGDNMASRPILIDNLGSTQTNVIPGTEFRCTWGADQSCFADSSIDIVKDLVDRHKAAGFSIEIVDYCVSSHTAAPTTAGWGAIAQTGGLSTDGDIPPVKELEWSRNGWTNTNTGMVAPDGNQAIAAPETQTGSVPTNSASPDCSAETTNVGIVGCAANWAIASTLGNVGNGQATLATIAGAAQSIDIRPGIGTTMSSAGVNLNIPLNTLFNTGLGSINPAASIVVASNTQHGGQAAMGLKMLGYNLIAGGYINSGLSRWEYDLGTEIWAPIGSVLPKPAAATMASPGLVDSTGPTVNSIAAESVTATSANIHRVAAEPATMKVEYGTSSGVYPDGWTNTVLNADKTVPLPSLTPNTHYYYRATSYDAYANPTVSAEGDFWTDVTAPVISNVEPADASTVYYNYPGISATLADTGGSGIDTDPAVTMVHIDSVMLMSGCTITTTSVSCTTSSGLSYGPHTLEIFTADLAGNPATSTTTFNVGDQNTPNVIYTGPWGTISDTSPTITGTVTDLAPSSGLPATGQLFLSTDGGSTWPYGPYTCTITGSDLSCPVTDTLPGSPATTYLAQIDVTDNAGNVGSGGSDFTVDATAPTVTADPVGFQPGNWTKDTTPALSATISGVPGGENINPATASVTIDAVACDGTVTANNTSVSCTPATPLSEGPHMVVYSAEYSAGHPNTDTHWVNIDTTAPSITGLAPTGTINTSTPTLEAYLDDGIGSGIHTGTIMVYLDGSATPLDTCIYSTTGVSCTVSVTTGDHTFSVTAADNAANSTTVTSGTFTLTQISYFWSWYDDVNADNWVLMANTDPVNSANYTLSIDNVGKALPGSGIVAPGDILPYESAGDMGGPVRAVSTNGVSGILSQRTLWPKGGNSLEEVVATEETKLSNHFWWTWYDQDSPGFQDWILISNPGGTTVNYEIKIAGVTMPTSSTNPGTIPAGGSVTPQFNGVIGGPVELTTTGGNVMASQRVLSNYGGAFNEVPGIPNAELTNDYMWTQYDEQSPGVMNWILIANPGGTPVTYEIKIGGVTMPTSADNPGTIAAGETVTPRFPGTMGGPVEVISTGGNVIASQRSVWGPSFEEVPGVGTLASNYHWTWYDESQAGVMNWILIANPGGTPVTYEIKIGGVTMPTSADNPGTIAAGARVIPRFPTVQDGPVEVTATGGNVIASQRVLWKGYFNEVLGSS